jgi:hypothetical protein
MTDMDRATMDRATAPPGMGPYIQWGPVIAGAVAAAALGFVLHAFAGAIGLAVSSTAPTWRDASSALWVLSGLYLVLVALAAYGLGGYIAGRLRSRLATATTDEVEFRDGAHGLLVWAIATLLTALLLAAGAAGATRLAAPSSGPAGPSTSVAGENIIAFDLDRLFRGERRLPEGNLEQHRAEAARVLLTSSSHRGVLAEDRTYLIRLVAALTGLAPPDAERRVDTVIAQARDNISRARRAAVILAFMAGAAALLGAAAAWFAAGVGGRHRDETAPPLRWTILGPRVVTRPPPV